MSAHSSNCTVLLSYDSSFIKESDFQEKLESKDDAHKIEALKCLIAAIVSGESYPKLLMSVIKFCLHSENHFIKKLLLLYWEVVEKKNKDGVLLHEMILVCNALKNNITHPNEFIRGSTLRFLCKIREAEILESLIPSITENLNHRHSYVRKNAVLTVYTVYSAHPDLIPDTPELIETFLYNETNPSAKRNAFLMLFLCSQDKAIVYLDTVIQSLGSSGESFQLIALELIRKVCRANPTLKGLYIKAIHNLVNSSTHSVAYEAATTLVALTAAPVAVRSAVTAYTQLLASESENNIKLVILQRLASLKSRNEKILQDMLMDILNTLSSPNIEIRRQTLSLALDLLTQRNVEDVVQALKKELIKCEAPEYAASSGNYSVGPRHDVYRKLLVDAMHACAIKFTHVVPTVVHLLLSYMGDENSAAALDVIYFVREIVQEYPSLRDDILMKLLDSFDEIKSNDVYRVALWIIGEYALDTVVLSQALQTIKASIGTLPLLPSATTVTSTNSIEEKRKEEEDVKSRVQHLDRDRAKRGPTVLADGTYATQSAVATIAAPSHSSTGDLSQPLISNLRALLLHGDFFLASCLAATTTKLSLRYASMTGLGSDEANKEIASTLLLLTALLRFGSVPNAVKQIDPDSQQRITLCLRTLLEPEVGQQIFNEVSRKVFAEMLVDQRKKSQLDKNHNNSLMLNVSKKSTIVAQPDDLITVRQLKGKGAEEDTMDSDEVDLSRALGAVTSVSNDISSSLHRVYQLTGFSDPIYAEAHLSVQSYDIVLDLLVVNQTNTILQNVSAELHTSGDLKVVERPAVHNLAPYASQRLTATIKLTSTESGVIFGNIVYDNSAGTVKSIVVLSNIHMDIEDYITPSYVSDASFRAMWAEFEWENKVAVATEIQSLNEYLNHIVTITNMKCLTPQQTLSGEANFLAANLYARSMFNEDALLNVSIEKQRNGKIGGYLRIRSKTQGIALSLGDKITARQKHNK